MKINQFITMGAQEAQTNQAYSVHHIVQLKGSIFCFFYGFIFIEEKPTRFFLSAA